MPITWRNVDAPTATGASRILDAAGRSLNTGLGQLSNLANQFTQVGNRNQANQNRINTQDSLSQIAGLGSFADLDAARQGGQFDPSNLVAGTDLEAVRKALANQGNVIDDRLSKEAAFQDRALGRSEKDTRIAANNALSSGNLSLAAELNSGLVDQSGINSGIRQQQAAIDAQAKARSDKLKGFAREDAQAQQQFENEQANIKLADQLANAPITEPLSPQAESEAITQIYDDIFDIAPNENFLGDYGFGAGGQDGVTLVREGVNELEKTIGRKVTSAELAQARDFAKRTKTGTTDSLLNLDANIKPNQIIEFLTELTGKDVEASNRVRRKAAKTGAASTRLQSELDKLRAGR